MLIPIRNHLVKKLLAWSYDCVDGREHWEAHGLVEKKKGEHVIWKLIGASTRGDFQ